MSECTHEGYFKLSAGLEDGDGRTTILPNGPNFPAAVNTPKEVTDALEVVKAFSADARQGGKLVTFTCETGCLACGIIPERKILKIKNGEILLDLPSEAV